VWVFAGWVCVQETELKKKGFKTHTIFLTASTPPLTAHSESHRIDCPMEALSEPLVEQTADSIEAGTTKRASKAAEQAVYRQRLGSRLWRVGVILRLFTLLNGLAVLVAVGYAIYCEVSNPAPTGSGPSPPRPKLEGIIPADLSRYLPATLLLRNMLRYATAAGVGVSMLVLEACTGAAEAATRGALGLAFGATGRFWLFCTAALLCAPMVRALHWWCGVSCATILAAPPHSSLAPPSVRWTWRTRRWTVMSRSARWPSR